MILLFIFSFNGIYHLKEKQKKKNSKSKKSSSREATYERNTPIPTTSAKQLISIAAGVTRRSPTIPTGTDGHDAFFTSATISTSTIFTTTCPIPTIKLRSSVIHTSTCSVSTIKLRTSNIHVPTSSTPTIKFRPNTIPITTTSITKYIQIVVRWHRNFHHKRKS